MAAGFVAPDRLARFRSLGMSGVTSLATHEWNFEAAAALLATAGRMEALVRQAMSEQLATYATSRGEEHWSASIAFDSHEARVLRRAVRQCQGRGDVSISLHGICEHMPLGFWLQLVSGRYHTRLWVPALMSGFPNLTGNVSARREQLHDALNRAVSFRNLAAHLHPLHSFSADEVIEPFAAVAAAIHPEVAAWLTGSSRIAQVWSSLPRGTDAVIPWQSGVSDEFADLDERRQTLEGSPLNSE
ncbi:MAG: hypothetical protein KGP01_03215 [Actinomycetales bacterium]|nr:hypothetical protein [Actinomycetales bacterium]